MANRVTIHCDHKLCPRKWPDLHNCQQNRRPRGSWRRLSPLLTQPDIFGIAIAKPAPLANKTFQCRAGRR